MRDIHNKMIKYALAMRVAVGARVASEGEVSESRAVMQQVARARCLRVRALQ